MDFIFGTSDFDQSRGNLIQLPVVNMYAEQAESEKNTVLLSRPGTTRTGIIAPGSGQITAIFQNPGVLSGNPYLICGGKLYRYNSASSIGTLDGTDRATIDCFPTRIFANQGGNVFTYDGTTFSSLTTPGSFLTTDICVGGDRLILLQQGTGVFWWSDLLSTNINALSFATAESNCDNLLDCLFLADTLILFGNRSVEFWPMTTDPNAPFQPLVGRTFNVGINNTHCATKFNGGFAWVTDGNRICFNDPTTILSTPGIEEHITGDTGCSLWTFWLEGTEFLALRLNDHNKTYVYSSKSQMWSEFRTYGSANWIPMSHARNTSGMVDILGGSNGFVYLWTGNYSDADATNNFIERVFRAGYPINGGTMPLNNIMLRMNMGQSGQVGQSAQIFMRTSKDGGQTWGSSVGRYSTTGTANDYRTRVQWRSQGFFSHPGILCEFSSIDIVPFRVSGVTGNESYADVGL